MAVAHSSVIELLMKSPVENFRHGEHAYIQTLVDRCCEPIIGMEHLHEVDCYDPDFEPGYLCKVCVKCIASKDAIGHMLCVEHRLKFLEKYEPQLFNSVAAGISFSAESAQLFVEECAKMISKASQKKILLKLTMRLNKDILRDKKPFTLTASLKGLTAPGPSTAATVSTAATAGDGPPNSAFPMAINPAVMRDNVGLTRGPVMIAENPTQEVPAASSSQGNIELNQEAKSIPKLLSQDDLMAKLDSILKGAKYVAANAVAGRKRLAQEIAAEKSIATVAATSSRSEPSNQIKPSKSSRDEQPTNQNASKTTMSSLDRHRSRSRSGFGGRGEKGARRPRSKSPWSRSRERSRRNNRDLKEHDTSKRHHERERTSPARASKHDENKQVTQETKSKPSTTNANAMIIDCAAAMAAVVASGDFAAASSQPPLYTPHRDRETASSEGQKATSLPSIVFATAPAPEKNVTGLGSSVLQQDVTGFLSNLVTTGAAGGSTDGAMLQQILKLVMEQQRKIQQQDQLIQQLLKQKEQATLKAADTRTVEDAVPKAAAATVPRNLPQQTDKQPMQNLGFDVDDRRQPFGSVSAGVREKSAATVGDIDMRSLRAHQAQLPAPVKPPSAFAEPILQTSAQQPEPFNIKGNIQDLVANILQSSNAAAVLGQPFEQRETNGTAVTVLVSQQHHRYDGRMREEQQRVGSDSTSTCSQQVKSPWATAAVQQPLLQQGGNKWVESAQQLYDTRNAGDNSRNVANIQTAAEATRRFPVYGERDIGGQLHSEMLTMNRDSPSSLNPREMFQKRRLELLEKFSTGELEREQQQQIQIATPADTNEYYFRNTQLPTEQVNVERPFNTAQQQIIGQPAANTGYSGVNTTTGFSGLMNTGYNSQQQQNAGFSQQQQNPSQDAVNVVAGLMDDNARLALATLLQQVNARQQNLQEFSGEPQRYGTSGAQDASTPFFGFQR